MVKKGEKTNGLIKKIIETFVLTQVFYTYMNG